MSHCDTSYSISSFTFIKKDRSSGWCINKRPISVIRPELLDAFQKSLPDYIPGEFIDAVQAEINKRGKPH